MSSKLTSGAKAQKEAVLPEWTRIRGRSGKAQVAIVTILQEEFDAVKEAGGFSDFVGSQAWLCRNVVCENTYDVILAKATDRGNTPCNELVTKIVELFRPEFVILSGIGGGVDGREGISLGDVVVADHIDWYEMRKMAGGQNKVRRQALDHPSSYLRDTIVPRVHTRGTWVDAIRADAPEGIDAKPKMIEGNIIAGEKVMGDKANHFQKLILKEFDKALAVDMESYGLGRAVYTVRGVRRYNLGYLVVRGISDLVGDEGNSATRERWRKYASATAASFALHVAEEIIASES